MAADPGQQVSNSRDGQNKNTIVNQGLTLWRKPIVVNVKCNMDATVYKEQV